MNTKTKIGIGIGIAIAVAGCAYFIIKKRKKAAAPGTSGNSNGTLSSLVDQVKKDYLLYTWAGAVPESNPNKARILEGVPKMTAQEIQDLHDLVSNFFMKGGSPTGDKYARWDTISKKYGITLYSKDSDK